jgi:hypothetical protein
MLDKQNLSLFAESFPACIREPETYHLLTFSKEFRNPVTRMDRPCIQGAMPDLR